MVDFQIILIGHDTNDASEFTKIVCNIRDNKFIIADKTYPIVSCSEWDCEVNGGDVRYIKILQVGGSTTTVQLAGDDGQCIHNYEIVTIGDAYGGNNCRSIQCGDDVVLLSRPIYNLHRGDRVTISGCSYFVLSVRATPHIDEISVTNGRSQKRIVIHKGRYGEHTDAVILS